jgi:hypothetical protein
MSPWTLLSDQTRGSCSACEDRRTSSMGRVSTGPVSRSARANPRVRNALSRHSTLGCRCAPRPGSRPPVSRTRTDPRSSLWATMRASSDVAPRCRHPTQVRTGCFLPAVGGTERTGAAGSDIETARLTSPQCSRTFGGSAAPACHEHVRFTRQARHPPDANGRSRCQAGGTSVSGRMSIRQPVRRAASRAFWPSLPIARDNW